jgi:hypothetical protein
MSEVNKIEALVASWYKNVPHLPKGGQKWLAENVWWLALVGLLLGGMAVLGTIAVTFFASAALIALGGAAGAVVGGVAVVATLVFLALSIVSLILIGLAISPLKTGAKKGWTLLFITALVNVLAIVIDFLFTFNLFGLVWGLLMAAVGGYFLFEIRSYFVQTKPVKVAEPVLKKAA